MWKKIIKILCGPSYAMGRVEVVAYTTKCYTQFIWIIVLVYKQT